jgi:hypothetical protein
MSMAFNFPLWLSRQYARVKEQPKVLWRNCQLTEMLVPVLAAWYVCSQKQGSHRVFRLYSSITYCKLMRPFSTFCNIMHPPPKSSSFSSLILSVREAFYCNFRHPVHCKEMGIITSSRISIAVSTPLIALTTLFPRSESEARCLHRSESFIIVQID